MIVVKLTGGLGNQMFQYAFGRYLATKHHTSLKLDTSYFDEFKLRNYELDVFAFQKELILKKDIEKHFNPTTLFGKIRRKIGNYKIISENKFEYDPSIIENSTANCHVIGYWQSEKYFTEVAHEIRQAFTFQAPDNELNEELIREIKNSNAVSIHVRRGDFVTDPKTNQVHGCCSIEYFERAISYVEKKLDYPVFYIFSDDINWVRNNLSILSPHFFIDHNKRDYDDMRLMSVCSHNIISNSSFSWWAAWLNPNKNKIVVAPQKWFNDSQKDTRDLIPESWVKI